MDEARFVNFLEESFGFDHGTGIGDDTSVVEIAPGAGYQLITKDLFIQDTHFSFDYYTPREVAQKALAVNLSDIAAMGGEPLYCYLGLGFPAKLRGSVFDDFFRGLREGCQKWNVQLAGGDYSSAPLVFISITLVGKAQSPVLRSTAQTGDLIGITGCTGESAAGLKLLQKGMHTGTMPRKHIHTTPYIKEGRILAPYANAMLDVSDGLLLDLKRILTASKKGAILRYNDIPVSDDLRRCCTEHHFNEQQLVLAGGEDYVLLFTLSPAKEAQLKETSLPYSIIGEITGSADQLDISRCDQPLSINSFGFDHFSVNK